MKLRLPLIMGITVAALVTATASPAFADATGDTATTFTMTAGTIDVVVPTTAAIAGSTTAVGVTTATGQLGLTSVTDNRGSEAGWVVSVDSSAFTVAGGSTSDTVSFLAAAATAPTGDATFASEGAVADISAGAVPTFSATAASGSTAASWASTITVHMPAGTLAGDYAGTVTTSVL